MAYNSTTYLTGNIGSEVKIIEKDGRTFGAVSIATKDSYQNEEQEWIEKDTLWHDVLIFNPRLLEEFKTFKSGSRIKITGSPSYKDITVVDANGETRKGKEVSFIARKVELATLTRKQQPTNDQGEASLDQDIDQVSTPSM